MSSSEEEDIMKPRGGGEHPLTVAVRVRPMSENEILAGGTQVAHPVDKQMVVLLDPSEDPDDILRANRSRERRYMFDHAFDDTADQDEVYQVTTRFLIDQVMNGYNGTVFAYGATGAGKTYTMLGTQDNPGIYSLALNDLFKLVAHNGEENIYAVSMSYLEIYNEMVRDLLNPTSGYLEMREDAKGGVQVANLSEISTASTEEIMELLQQGNMERTQEPTKANETSSRSHAVLQIQVKQRSRARGINSQVKIGRLFLVDLAGSERAANTQNRGKRMVEGAHINRSLLALGNCITALSESSERGARTYVNFRDSKLTRLLKDALGGNCKTVMIAHLSPASFHFEESRNTLLYADRAKRIKNKVRRNVEDVSYHIAQYSQIISELRGEIERLRAKVSQSMTHEPASIQAVQNEVLRNANDQEFFKLKEQLMMTFKDQMELRRSLMELSNTGMEISLESSRNALLISEWESEQSKAKERKENGLVDKDLDKKLDLEGLSYEEEETEDISIAREELKVLLNEKKKTEKLRLNVSKELEFARQKAAMLEENLPKYVSTESQKEILTLLLRIHELEIQNIEYQSQIYLREHDLSQKDFIISRYQNYRSLAEEIISQQRYLLNDNNIITPRGLEELYDMYQQEAAQLEEGITSQRNFLPTIKSNGSHVSLTEIGASNANLDRLSTLAEETPSRYASSFSRHNAVTQERSSGNLKLPTTPLLIVSHSPDPRDEETSKVFSVSPRSLGVKAGIPRHLAVSPLKPNRKEDTLYTISMRSNSLESLEKKDSPPQPQPKPVRSHDQLQVNLTPKVNQETRGIAALAAAKKRRQQQQDIMASRLTLQDSQRTFISSYDDGERLTPSRLATHNLKYGSRYNINDDTESYDNRSQNTETRKIEHVSPAKAGGKIPRAKYRSQATHLRVPGAANSDRMSDKTADTPHKNVRQPRKAQPVVRSNKQGAWKSQESVRRPPAKPRTNKITSRYLKTLGTASNSNDSTNYKPSTSYKPVSDKKSKGKGQPTISSYHKGDISVSGFGIRY